MPDIEAALDRAIARGDAEVAVGCAVAAALGWRPRGRARRRSAASPDCSTCRSLRDSVVRSR